MIVCEGCGREFDPADRASPTAQEGSIVQIKYCSEKCARKAESRRYYLANRERLLQKKKEESREYYHKNREEILKRRKQKRQKPG